MWRKVFKQNITDLWIKTWQRKVSTGVGSTLARRRLTMT